MIQMPSKKIVYLFGAGATRAEAQYVTGVGEGLSLEHVSEAAIIKAKEDPDSAGMLSDVAPDDINDIELYITLLESLRTEKYSGLAAKLRSLFCQTIQENLHVDGTQIEPNLTMGLLKLHNVISEEEQIAGIISLNYDNLLDRACNEVFKGLNYGIKAECEKAESQ
jgi:hypothetical protein